MILIRFMTMKMKTINKGFLTEETHYQHLRNNFEYVTPPKNSGGGSDFVVFHNGARIAFESKTSNTDIFDAGVVSIFANGHIKDASYFLANNHLDDLQRMFHLNIEQVHKYVELTGATEIPHSIPVSLFDDVKAQKKLIHITTNNVLNGIVEQSFTKSHNGFIKANYIVVGDNVFCMSDKRVFDPLSLIDRGAPVLGDDHINTVHVRSARSGTRSNGLVSVTMRTQFRMHKDLPESPVKLSELTP